jgi:hypothetical protein
MARTGTRRADGKMDRRTTAYQEAVARMRKARRALSKKRRRAR